MSFFTVARNEYYRPYDEISGNFNFQNWQSFLVFMYLIVILILGLILATNFDAKDLAKLNDMDEHELMINEQQGVSFPLLAFALKRQVTLMNYINHDEVAKMERTAIPTKSLWLLNLINHHPLLY